MKKPRPAGRTSCTAAVSTRKATAGGGQVAATDTSVTATDAAKTVSPRAVAATNAAVTVTSHGADVTSREADVYPQEVAVTSRLENAPFEWKGLKNRHKRLQTGLFGVNHRCRGVRDQKETFDARGRHIVASASRRHSPPGTAALHGRVEPTEQEI